MLYCRLHPADLQRPLQPDPAAAAAGAGADQLPRQQQGARHLPPGQPRLHPRHRVSQSEAGTVVT